MHLSSKSISKDSFFELSSYHGQTLVLSSVPKGKLLLLVSWHSHQHVIKDVIVSLLGRLHMKAHIIKNI